MSFIKNLSESKSFPSTKHLGRYDIETLCELAVLCFCSLNILYHVPETKQFTQKYVSALMNANSSHFKKWAMSGNDLYAILHGICGDEKLAHDDSHVKRKTIPVGLATMDTWMSQVKKDTLDKAAHGTFFTRLDYNFQINNSSLRAVRRLVADWSNLSHTEQQYAMTRLLQMLRARLPKCDLLDALSHAAHVHNLELHDVCNKETGHGCGEPETGANVHRQKKDDSGHWGAKALAFGAGLGLSAALHHKSIKEDDGGGAPAGDASTTSSNIATVVKPLMPTIKRK